MQIRTSALLAGLFVGAMAFCAPPAQAEVCANPNALGTRRIMTVDAATTPRVGTKHFPTTLPLAPHEFVLTFDDGPWPGTTSRVLDALREECVHATFFMLGRNAEAHPALARRALLEGHTVASHTFSHPLLGHMPIAKAEAEITRGMVAVDKAAHGEGVHSPATPFFRFPGFVSSPRLLDYLEQRHVVVFGADLWASDWNVMTAQQELTLLLARVEAAGSGILLLHDTKAQTAAMLPAFLRTLKARGYHIVHAVPAGSMLSVAR